MRLCITFRAVGCRPAKANRCPAIASPASTNQSLGGLFREQNRSILKDSIGKISGNGGALPRNTLFAAGRTNICRGLYVPDELLRTGYHIQGLDANSSKISIIDQT